MSAATADLVIQNGMIVSPDAATVGSVAIKDGRVLAVGAAEAMPPGARNASMPRACTFCPAPSMCMCISAIPAIRTRRTGRAARPPPLSAA